MANLSSAMAGDATEWAIRSAPELIERVRALPEQAAAFLRGTGMDEAAAKALAEKDPAAAATAIQKATGVANQPPNAAGLTEVVDPRVNMGDKGKGFTLSGPASDPGRPPLLEAPGFTTKPAETGAPFSTGPAGAGPIGPQATPLTDLVNPPAVRSPGAAPATEAAYIEPAASPALIGGGETTDADWSHVTSADHPEGAERAGQSLDEAMARESAAAGAGQGASGKWSTAKKAAVAGGVLGATGVAAAAGGAFSPSSDGQPAKTASGSGSGSSSGSGSAPGAGGGVPADAASDPAAPVVAEVTKRVVPQIVGPKPIAHMDDKDIDAFVKRTRDEIARDDLTPAERSKASVSDAELEKWGKQRTDLINLFKQAKQDNAWGEVAEKIGFALVQFAAARQGLRSGVDTSGVAAGLKPTDWLRRNDQALAELKESLTNEEQTEKERNEQARSLRARIDEISRRRAGLAKDETTLRADRARDNRNIDIHNATNETNVGIHNAQIQAEYDKLDDLDARNKDDNKRAVDVANINAGSRETVQGLKNDGKAFDPKEARTRLDSWTGGMNLLEQARQAGAKDRPRLMKAAMEKFGRAGVDVSGDYAKAGDESWTDSGAIESLQQKIAGKKPVFVPGATLPATPPAPGAAADPREKGVQAYMAAAGITDRAQALSALKAAKKLPPDYK